MLTLIETCYKALFNSMTRAIQDKDANKRLMEKAMRLQFIVDGMKERGESEEMIQEVIYFNSRRHAPLILDIIFKSIPSFSHH